MINVLDDVKNRLFVLTPGADGWTRRSLDGVPEFGTIGAKLHGHTVEITTYRADAYDGTWYDFDQAPYRCRGEQQGTACTDPVNGRREPHRATDAIMAQYLELWSPT